MAHLKCKALAEAGQPSGTKRTVAYHAANPGRPGHNFAMRSWQRLASREAQAAWQCHEALARKYN